MSVEASQGSQAQFARGHYSRGFFYIFYIC